LNKYPKAEDFLTHWARDQRVTNHCGWDHESIIYKIMKQHIIIPLSVGDTSDIDRAKAKATQHAIDELVLIDSECVVVLSQLYVFKSSTRLLARMADMSKSSIHRLKEKGLSWLERNIDVYY